MLQQAVVNIVDYCTRYAAQIIGIAALLGLATAIYAAGHFAIDADVYKLISKELPWRQREVAFEKSFPRKEETILAIIDAPTSELATQATTVLIEKLAGQKDLFRFILEAGGGPFFRKNGLLFLPAEEVVGLTKKLGEAKPLIQTLAQDSNLRGLTTALNYGLIGARMNQYTLDDLSGTLNMVSDTLDEAIAGHFASFSWRAMLNGRPPKPDERRRFIEIRPVLDYAALMPGKVATDAIRQAAADLDIGTKYGARVRLTGPVAIADEEYATLEEGAYVNTAVTIVVVLIILWLALRSFGIILAVATSLLVGLSITAAIGLAIVGALNLISVAFAVLFIGLGVDFGIQFSVRYRAERHEVDDLHEALVNTARHVGAPLTLAAAATAAGFLSFLPTDYKGLSELGLLAGLGMIVAFLTSITLIPALLTVLRPPGEPEEMGFKSLAPVDRFMERHRIPIIVGTGLVVAAGLPLLYWLQFDFNPLNLRNPHVESVATFLELRSDPAIGASSIFVLAPNKEAAQADVEKLSKVPEVSSVKTIENFIPDDQQPKLAAIRQLATVLDPILWPDPNKKPPVDADNVAALKSAVDALKQAAGNQTGRGAVAARRLADDLDLPVMTHLLETRLQVVTAQTFYGRSMVEHLDAIGFLRPSTALIHAVWLTPRDRDLIAASGASMQYNPWSNGILGSGVADFRAAREAGINVSMGSDGCGATYGCSMLTSLKLGGVMSRISRPDYENWATAKELWHSATVGGANALGRDHELGRLAPGQRADIVFYRRDSYTLSPLNDPVRQIVNGESGSAIDTVVVDGTLAMRSGKLTRIDEAKLVAEFNAAHEELAPTIVESEQASRALLAGIDRIYRKSLTVPIASDTVVGWVTGTNVRGSGNG